MIIDIIVYRYHKNSGTRVKKSDIQWLRVTRTRFIEALCRKFNLLSFSQTYNVVVFFQGKTQPHNNINLSIEMFVYVHIHNMVQIRDWA